MAVCKFPECGRPMSIKSTGLCITHHKQHKMGMDLVPIKSPTKYPQGAECKWDGCTKRPTSNWFCGSHNAMSKYHVKERAEYMSVNAMTSKFSTERQCGVCLERKDWKQMAIGFDPPRNICKDCHKKELLPTLPNRPKATTEDILRMLPECNKDE